MALSRDIRIAFRRRNDNRVNLSHVNAQVEDTSFENRQDLPCHSEEAWQKECMTALSALNTHFEITHFRGMDLLVSCDVRQLHGLDFANQRVVAFALAYLKTIDKNLHEDIRSLQLAEVLTKAVDDPGTSVGEMAVFLHGDASQLYRVNCSPLRVDSLPLSEQCCFVLADPLLTTKEKENSLDHQKHTATLCALAQRLLEKRLQEEFGSELMLPRLSDLWYGPLCLTHSEVDLFVDQAIPKPLMTLDAIARTLELSTTEIQSGYLQKATRPEQGYPLRGHLRHLFSEFKRVETARDALLADDLVTFGTMLNDSCISSDRDFAGTPAPLNSLLKIARDAGAPGAGVTAYKAGGQALCLVQRDQFDDFCLSLRKKYYQDSKQYNGELPVFVAQAAPPAAYEQISKDENFLEFGK
jgi:galactokinase